VRDSATIPHLAAVRGRAGALAWRSVETARDAGRRGDSQGSDTFALSTRMCEWTSDGQHYTNEGSPPPNRRAFIDAVDDTVAAPFCRPPNIGVARERPVIVWQVSARLRARVERGDLSPGQTSHG